MCFMNHNHEKYLSGCWYVYCAAHYTISYRHLLEKPGYGYPAEAQSSTDAR